MSVTAPVDRLLLDAGKLYSNTGMVFARNGMDQAEITIAIAARTLTEALIETLLPKNWKQKMEKTSETATRKQVHIKNSFGKWKNTFLRFLPSL
jgi:hypothetical protein